MYTKEKRKKTLYNHYYSTCSSVLAYICTDYIRSRETAYIYRRSMVSSFSIACLTNPYQAYISIFNIKRRKNSSNKMYANRERIVLVDFFFFSICISIEKKKNRSYFYTRITAIHHNCVVRIINRTQ